MYVLRRRTRIEIWTPAKLNLFLEVLERRDDGFHEIETLMVPVSLYDTLRFAVTDDARIELACRWSRAEDRPEELGDLPTSTDNLAYRAVVASAAAKRRTHRFARRAHEADSLGRRLGRWFQ